MINHPNVIRAYFKWEVKNGSPRRVLVIETDLELDSEKPEFDSSELDDLVDRAEGEMKERQTVIDRVDVIPAAMR